MARFPLDTLPVAMQQVIRDAEYVTSHGLLFNPVMMVSPSAQEILDEFRQHRLRFPSHTCGRKLDDTILRFELCPTAAETRGWSREDWMQLIHEFIQTLDPLEKVKLKQQQQLCSR